MGLSEEKSNILSEIYYDSANQAGFSSKLKLWHEARLINQNISSRDVDDWLRGQLVYTLHRDVRRNFLRNKIIVSEIDELWQADLVDLQEFKNKNAGHGYILTIVDVFSKFAWAIPIKNKGSKSVSVAFMNLFRNSKRIPVKILTDRGLEFLNKEVQGVFKNFNIHHFTAVNPRTKCLVVERFNRTLKSRMFEFSTANGTRRYYVIF